MEKNLGPRAWVLRTKYFNQTPTLVPGQGSTFLKRYAIARVCLAMFVMDLITPTLDVTFPVLGVEDRAVNLNHNGLFHLVGNHRAGERAYHRWSDLYRHREGAKK
jgi:hypothetical protein